MDLKFEKFDKSALDLINSYRRGTNALGSEFSFASFLLWYDNIEVAKKDGALYLRAFYEKELVYFVPLTNGDINEALLNIPEDIEVNFATEDVVKKLDATIFEAESIRDYAEYIYKSSDLINLVGKRYNAKRNHISKFNNYNYTFLPYCENDRDDVYNLMKDWIKSHDDGSIQKAENTLNQEFEMLRCWVNGLLDFGLFADVLRVDGELAGVSVGEISVSGVGIVMFEKANIKFNGVYAALSNLFAKAHFSGIEYVNRQEDMGLEGLRKSKLSLNPEIILDKYYIKRRKK